MVKSPSLRLNAASLAYTRGEAFGRRRDEPPNRDTAVETKQDPTLLGAREKLLLSTTLEGFLDDLIEVEIKAAGAGGGSSR
jgi:hypothetical protein